MDNNLIYLINAILGAAGFFVAFTIHCKKVAQRPLICPLNMKCDQVLCSKYSRFLGIEMEYLGMIYYAIITSSYLVFAFAPNFIDPVFVFTIFTLTLGAFIFSLYLISIQAFKLKEWCSWCLMSAAISTIIFILTLQNETISNVISSLANSYYTPLISIYSLALVLGFVISAITETLFIRFIKDGRISPEEGALHLLRQMTWLAIGIVVSLRYAILATKPIMVMSTSSIFLAENITLGLLVLINLIYDFFVSSKLIEIFSDKQSICGSSCRYLKIASYVFGPISLAIWLIIIILGLT